VTLADLITCTMLYTGAAMPLKAPGTLRTGDANDEVAQLQTWLSSYGYYDRNITGVFGATTEIAVRLCQMTNGLPATGEADEGLLAMLFSGGVEALDNVRESLREQLYMQGDSARTVIGNVAMRLRGQSFEPDDEDLYEGFAFVQYVCVLAGIPVVYPEDLMELAAEQVSDYSVLQAGDVLAVHSADGRILLAVSAGNGSAIYATQDSGYVLETDLRSLVNGELRRWNMSASAE
jgi:hypothetical protein